MKTFLAVLIFLVSSMTVYAAKHKCVINERMFGSGLEIEERELITDFINEEENPVMLFLLRYKELIDDDYCNKPVAQKCEISERLSGSAIMFTEGSVLISDLYEETDNIAQDFQAYVDFGVCEKPVARDCEIKETIFGEYLVRTVGEDGVILSRRKEFRPEIERELQKLIDINYCKK